MTFITGNLKRHQGHNIHIYLTSVWHEHKTVKAKK